jgi:multidrug efflux pump subunit AcrA (membrane-fusion protein)
MLIRISLIVAIIAGVAIGVGNFVVVKDKINVLQTDLANTKTDLANTRNDLASTKRKLAQTQSELDATNKILEATITERDEAVKEAAAQTKRATQLAADLTKTRAERDSAQQELAAYKATGFSPEQVLTLGRTLKQTQDALTAMQDENKVLNRTILSLNTKLRVYEDPQFHVPLPPDLKGKILVTDPKWEFVVLNVGADQGVLAHGELLVSRDGRLVAKVQVTSVQKDRCIANVMPGWKLGDVMEGDQVIPAYPKSS